MSGAFPTGTANGAATATVIDFFGALIMPKATAATTDGAIDVAEQIVPAGFATPLHVHHREDECFYVLDGAIAFRLGAATFLAQSGAFVRLPRDIPPCIQRQGRDARAHARIRVALWPGRVLC